MALNQIREVKLLESVILKRLSRQLVCNVQCSIVAAPNPLLPTGTIFTLGTTGMLNFEKLVDYCSLVEIAGTPDPSHYRAMCRLCCSQNIV